MGNFWQKLAGSTEKVRKGLADAKKPKPAMTAAERRAEADKKAAPKKQSDGVYR